MKFKTVLLIYAVAASLQAQEPYGRVTGRIIDSAGAVVPGATVRVIHTETNVTVSTASDSQGNFEARNVLPGFCRVVVEQQGFKRYERTGLEVRIGDVLAIEAALELGSVSESVTVTAEAPLLESASSSVGQVIDHRRLMDLPLPGASPMYLVQLAAGVVSQTPPTHGWLPQTRNNLSNFASSGAPGNSSEFTLDGIPNMTRNGIVNLEPMAEMLQEFRVQTAAYDASVGHFTGSQVNMVTKSGANELHGNGTFSHTSRPLMSRPFFVNRQIYDTRSGPPTQDKIDALWPYSRLNRYRGTAGGPVYLPHVYNGRNKTFWTFGIDQFVRTFVPAVSALTVPSAAERNGDFSALLKIGAQYQMYDPATIATAANGRTSRQPLPGNVIPASRIDPVAKAFLKYIPQPNASGTADGLNNYAASPVSAPRYWSSMGRVDHAINDNHRLFVSYLWGRTNDLQQIGFTDPFLGLRTLGGGYNLALDDVITLRPNLILDMRYGMTRARQDNQPGSVGFDVSSFGWPASLAGKLDPKTTMLPQINIDGYAAVPPNYSGLGNLTTTTYHTAAASLAHARGAHSLRFGGEFRTLQEDLNPYAAGSPSFNFGADWTRGPLDSSPAAPIGQGLGSFLLGLPTGGSIPRNASYAEQSRYLGFFIQDDWKLARKLTINIGLRYELELPATERYNRTNRGFDFATANPVNTTARANYAANPIPEVAASAFRASGGLLFAGVNGVPRGLFDTDTNNFSPRIGIAYVLRPKTVLRAGCGIFFDSLGADRNGAIQQGFSQSTAVTPSLDNGLTFRGTLANPFPDGIVEPAGASGGLATFVGRNVQFLSPRQRPGYMQRWSFNVQQELPRRILMELGYMGNRGTGLGVAEDLNTIPALYLSTTGARDQARIDFLNQAVQNPFFGIAEFAGSSLQARTVPRSQLLKPYPEFGGVSTRFGEGFSWFHALELRVERRWAQGFSIQGSYTFSKFMEAANKLNPSDLPLNHAISALDRPHHVVISGIYELPFAKRKRGWMGQAAGGWSVQAIYQGQSGPPLAFGDVIFNGNLHDIVLPAGDRKVERWFNTDAGFEKASNKQLASDIRLFPARLTGARADGYNNWDLSLFKTFRIADRVRFQLRAEGRDALNHAMFAAPTTTPTSTLFGQVTKRCFPSSARFR